jgi:P-type conjugative transfer protein TrbG
MFSQKMFSSRCLSLITLSVLLGGCISPNLQTTSPPAIERDMTFPMHVPSKGEFLQAQTQDVKKALTQYELTGNAEVIETSQAVKFPFGQNTPIIYCTPLRTCEIKLEVGESITGVYPGDTSRWLFEEAISGQGAQQQSHVIFKPKHYDIVTNAIITTTKRTYNVELHSKKDAAVKQFEFYYPQDIEEQWRAILKEALLERKAQNNQLHQAKLIWNQPLDFHYRIETAIFAEKPIWTPLRVFNDGVHVYIEIPPQAATTSLPSLLTLGKDDQPKLVNYRIQKPYYIVDELFQQAILEIGTGQEEKRVTITYNP